MTDLLRRMQDDAPIPNPCSRDIKACGHRCRMGNKAAASLARNRISREMTSLLDVSGTEKNKLTHKNEVIHNYQYEPSL